MKRMSAKTSMPSKKRKGGSSRSRPMLSKKKKKPKTSPLRKEINILLLVFSGLLIAAALVAPDATGPIGRTLQKGFQGLLGKAAWGIPPLMLIIALYRLFNRPWPRPSETSLGGFLLFFSFVASLGRSGPTTLPPFEWEHYLEYGGVVGTLLARLLDSLLGPVGFLLVIGATGLIGILLLFGLSTHRILSYLLPRLTCLLSPKREKVPQKKASQLPSSPSLTREEEKGGDLQKPPPPVLSPSDRSQPVVHSQALEKIDRLPTEPLVDAEGPFELPPLSLLNPATTFSEITPEEREENIRILEATLADFKIEARVVEICHGPTVTRYEIQLAPGINVKKIVSLADNLAMSLAAIDVRVEAPIPGKSAIGVEVPNRHPVPVSLRTLLETKEFAQAPSKLTVALGLDIAGLPRYADIAKMPHLLIGGSTNSGKSVCLHVIIASLLFRATPEEVKLLLIDPKRVELSLYDQIPHLIYPVVKDVRQAAGVLRWAIKEMDRRYELLARAGARNLESYNKKLPPGERPLPYLVIVIDELADMMIQVGAEVEQSITRLAQLARAVGLHLIIATQRPSADIITGTIKTNISSRIAFAVASGTDSRIILDQTGAERLVGKGDMLFLPIDAPKPIRIQGAYITETEIEALVAHLRKQGKPDYEAEVMTVDTPTMGREGETDDELFEQAVRLVVATGHASTSMLQRKFKIGYTRAARLIDIMEEQGIVGPMDTAKPREVLLSKEEVDAFFQKRFQKVYEEQG